MPKIPFYMAGEVGLVKDVEAHELPPQAWTDVSYMKFRDGKALRRRGSLVRYPGHLGRPFWLMFAYTTSNSFWIYADLTKMYATDGASHAEITHAAGPYTSLARNRLWTGGILKGIPVMTNGIEVPQAWTNINLSNDLVDLPNWTVGEICNVIKPFKDFLIALVITRGGMTLPQMVKWSHPADPGSLPISWDVADPTKLAGEREIGDEFAGGIRDGLSLRDAFIIYKDNSVWGMQFIGGNDVFRTYQILSGLGILGTHCVCAINKGTQHFFASADDLIVFDGQNTQSVLDKRLKTWLTDNIDPGVSERSFVFAQERYNEAWFCFPTHGNEFCNMAIIWNWVENTLTLRPVQWASASAMGAGETTGDPWDLDPAVWDGDSTPWDLLQFRVNQLDTLIASPATSFETSSIHQVDESDQVLGVNYSAYLERVDIPFASIADGLPKADFANRKICTRLWVRASGDPIECQVGSHEDMGTPVVWEPMQLFTPGVDRYLDWTANGLLLAVRFVLPSGAVTSKINGFDMTVELLGEL